MEEAGEANPKEKYPMSVPKMPRWQQWAQFRFAVIGGLLSRPMENGQLQKELKVLAEQQKQLLPLPSYKTVLRCMTKPSSLNYLPQQPQNHTPPNHNNLPNLCEFNLTKVMLRGVS